MAISSFYLTYLRREQHLMLPRVSSILLAQNLYDVLFQYAITPEKEEKLEYFIGLLEDHIKTQAQAPFSRSIQDLEFLDDGLRELKLLNWTEVTVSIFELHLQEEMDAEQQEDAFTEVVNMLESYMICKREPDSNLLYVYPSNLIRY